MKFKFELEKVRTHRKNLEDIAKSDYLEALALLNIEKEKLTQLQNAIEESRQLSFQTQSRGGHAGSALGQIFEFQKGQDVRIERQKKVIAQHEIKVENLQEILRLKAIDYKIIDKLKDKKREEFKFEQSKKEQKLVDNLNTMRFFKKE